MSNPVAKPRTPAQLRRLKGFKTRNIGNSHALGKYRVPTETVLAMAEMRQRGKTWGQVGRKFGRHPASAYNLVKRRCGDVA